jgi:hypothetical protein
MMGRILYLTDDEVGMIELHSKAGDSTSTWLIQRLEEELDTDFLGQALKLSIETEQALASTNKRTQNSEGIRLHTELDRLLNEMPQEEVEAFNVAKDAIDKIMYQVFRLDPHSSKKDYKPKHAKAPQ